MVTLTPSVGAPLAIPTVGALRWSDEDTWQPVEQRALVCNDGTMALAERTRRGPRPLTLSGRPSYAAERLDTLRDLVALCATPGLSLEVALEDGRRYRCQPRRDGDTPSVEYALTVDALDAADDSLHQLLELRLVILEGPL